jgi:retinol-binding protein 3
MTPHWSKDIWLSAITAIALIVQVAGGQQPAPATIAGTVDATTRSQVIDLAIAQMQKAYIFADTAEKMAAALRTHAANKEYDALTTGQAFADMLTRHLQEVSRDKHLRIRYFPEGLPQRPEQPNAEERARAVAEERRRNFNFERVERLDGNVGYIDLRGFSGSREARGAAVAAMNLVADTDALIFDLRRNGGGSPFMIGILSSYLFDEVVHLNDFYVRETDAHEEFFTAAEVEGRRYGRTKPVFVLTSGRTFSAAEEFTYNLKNLKRATIVGETTGGGAHPGGLRRLTDHFGIWLPTGRAINPITKTNWEGTGVEPDIKTASADALKAAHLEALVRILASATDTRHRQQVQQAIDALKRPS